MFEITRTICSNLQEKLEFFPTFSADELESIAIFCSYFCTRFSLNVLLFISSTDLLLLSIYPAPVWHGTGDFYLYVFVRSDFKSDFAS